MKNLIILFAFVAFFFSSYETIFAQNYKRAIGLRLGYPTSVTFKNFLNESHAIEAYAGTRGWSTYRWFNVAGAYQFHKDIEGVDNLQYYFGAGASVFFWSFDFDSRFSSTTIGLQGYAGLDYSFDDIPLNISLDWIPTIYLGSAFTSGFAGGFGTLGVRYIINE
ncbi:MAG: hypothetical protein AAF696_07385 [Bacteroidota bacterium]